MTVFSLDVLLFLLGTSLLFHVQFNCCFLTCIQISQEAGQVVWYSNLFQNFPQFIVIHMMKVKVESKKVGLKLNIQKMKIMVSGPITPWEIDGETAETCQTLFLGAPKSLQMVTAATKLKDTYSLEEKL